MRLFVSVFVFNVFLYTSILYGINAPECTEEVGDDADSQEIKVKIKISVCVMRCTCPSFVFTSRFFVYE